MRTCAFVACSLLGLVPLASCSAIVQTKQVRGTVDLNDLPRMDANDPNSAIIIKRGEVEGRQRLIMSPRPGSLAIEMKQDPCRVKCHFFLSDIDVVGELIGCSHTYPIIIDTGYARTIMVNSIHLRDNRLPVYVVDGEVVEMCHLPDLRIGDITLRRLAAYYRLQYTESKILGLLTRGNERIYLGVSLLKWFRYVALDGRAKEVEFSKTKRFDPPDPNAWSRYPFVQVPESEGRDRICVNMSILGQNMTVWFDTGTALALLAKEKVWNQMRPQLSGVRGSWKQVVTPHLPETFQPKNFTVDQITVGARTIQNANIGVVGDDASPFDGLPSIDAILGMKSFADTVVVLDFEHKTLWVKNPPEP